MSQVMNGAERRAANEAAIRQFFSSWDPTWRWVLVLGLRDLRADLARLGHIAATETGSAEWDDESYVYGPLALGLTAAAVNEVAQHCEDLFALLSFLQEPMDFIKRTVSYPAGKVTRLAKVLLGESDTLIRSRFLVPTSQVIADGLSEAVDPAASEAAAEEAVTRLGALTRNVADWYLAQEFFHLQYKHGLKLPLRPFGSILPPGTVNSRRESLKAPLIALTNEPLTKMLAKPPAQQLIVIPGLVPAIRDHIDDLLKDQALLRYQMSGPEIDLDSVVEVSFTVLRLMRIAADNRLTISNGAGPDSQQVFALPGPGKYDTTHVRLKLTKQVLLGDFRRGR